MQEKLKRKVIFLDIDGVVATNRAYDASLKEWWGVDSAAEANRLQIKAKRDGAFCPDLNMENWPFDPVAVSILQ